MGMPIQGGVAVVRPGAKAPSYRVVPPHWSSPVPNAGSWWEYLPAGCEVCRERPAVTRAYPWTKTEPRHALTHERDRDEKLACGIPPHVRPDTNPQPTGQSRLKSALDPWGASTQTLCVKVGPSLLFALTTSGAPRLLARS